MGDEPDFYYLFFGGEGIDDNNLTTVVNVHFLLSSLFLSLSIAATTRKDL